MRLQLRRSSLKPWNWSTRTWLLALFVCAVISPAVSRWIWLWQVPDVALPFDVEEFIGTETPKEQGAFAHYATAAKMLRQAETDWSSHAIVYAGSEEPWDDRLDQWLISNSDILTEFELGTRMQHAGGTSLRTCGTTLEMMSTNKVDPSNQDLRNLLRLPLKEALRCERNTKFEEAWRWYRVLLRFAAHVEESRLLTDYFLALGIRDAVFDSVWEWASQPSLTSQQLQSARVEITQSFKNRPNLSDILKAEYLEQKHLLESELVADCLFPEWYPIAQIIPFEPASRFGKRFLAWSAGQPELSLRLMRQVLVNNLGQVDRPLHLQCPVARTERPLLFELEPGKPCVLGQLNIDQLRDAVSGHLGRRLNWSFLFFLLGTSSSFGNEWDGVDAAYRFEEDCFKRLEIALAAHEFQRLHCEFPFSIDELVPRYLASIPQDPFRSIQAPMRYRRIANNEAIVWSKIAAESNNTAEIEEGNRWHHGYRLCLKNKTVD